MRRCDNIPADARKLEQESDRYLEDHGFIQHRKGRKNEAEIFTETQISDKSGRDIHCPDEMLHAVLDNDLADMFESEVVGMGRLARLTDIQMDIWRLHVYGVRLADIARSLYDDRTVDAGYVLRTIKKCKAKIARAAWLNPYYGWLWVYLKDVHRH